MIQIEDLERRVVALEQRITPAETHTEPRPLLANAKVGDIATIEMKHGEIEYQLVSHVTEIHVYAGQNGVKTRYSEYSKIDGTCTIDNRFKILSAEPLAEVGSADWMIQMAKLGNPVCHPGLEYAPNSPYLLTDDGKAIVCRRENFLDGTYSFDYCKENYPTGWQIYEPKPKIKVGEMYDWNTRPIEDALRARITELEYQLGNYKAAADGTTHWCPECKMRDDRIKKLESENDDLQQAVNGIWLPEHVEKLHMEILRLTKLLEKQ